MLVDGTLSPDTLTSTSSYTYNPVKRGDKVLIKKGTNLWSCNPSKRNFVVKKNYIVTIHDYNPGWKVAADADYHPAEVCWAGTHGYWTYARLEDVVVLKDNLTLIEETAKLRGLI